MSFEFNNPTFKERRRDLRRRQTDAEKSFWKHVRNRQLVGLRFIRQYSVGPCIIDFYCPEKHLAVELDGEQHSDPETAAYDRARTDYLKTKEITVVRFWNNQVLKDIQGVLEGIKPYLK